MELQSGRGFRRLAPFFARLIRAAFLGTAMLAGTELAGAASLYNIAKVHVDVTARDAVIAREKGIAEAETRAMDRLLRRLVPLSSQASLPTFPHSEIEGLVAGIAIRSEKMSATRYIGVLDVRFYPGAVRQLLISRSIPFVDAPASAISILPVMLQGDRVATNEGSADWREAWERLDLENGVAPATLVASRGGLNAKTVRAVVAGDTDAYAGLRSIYGYGGLVIAAGELVDGFFRVRLAGEDAAGRVDAAVTSAVNARDRQAAADAAARLALTTLERRWQKRLDPGFEEAADGLLRRRSLYPDDVSGTDEAALGHVGAVIEFFSARDWQQIHFGLQRVEGLRDFAVTSRSARAAQVTFDFAGSVDQLQAVLAQNGIALYERDGTLVMRAR